MKVDSYTNIPAECFFPKVPSADHLRLHMGELTPNEVRIAQAAYRLALVEMRKQDATPR